MAEGWWGGWCNGMKRLTRLEAMGFTPDECQQITEIGIQYAVSGAGVGPIELGLLIMRLRPGGQAAKEAVQDVSNRGRCLTNDKLDLTKHS